ncbi:MAG: hypothetical protein ACKO41_05000 [Sphingomonadales bacterium]
MTASTSMINSHNRATAVTVLMVLLIGLLLSFLRWKIPVFEQISSQSSVEVEVNWPPDPPAENDGGGGGGQTALATAEAGLASPAPMTEGTPDPAAVTEADENSAAAALPSSKTSNPNKKKIQQTSTTTKPVAVVKTPSPPQPRAVMGKTNTGVSGGGGATENFEQTGGRGNGLGAGTGDGSGGGSGGGLGGGTGTGTGLGVGPRVTKGDRKIVRSYAFEGDLNKATIYANILVAPDGTGQLIGLAKGSSTTGSAYKQAITRYLEKMRFDVSDHESMVTVQFNFRIN